ncbi:branched-chain amino acid ABC transporter permease [Azospirillum sp. RWY-5-1]|uniref:Branched-chain amino acid ABC transporter permease n=1 Tax=Azospirillum oleiclasticum TaxID=2735135 RepID=A0ABX2TC96_9PROT|nr:branched-chain amino acid ABC transporter permease [Azospirillum oleiclasticum]NYZ15660.1 branched-chain amino acid ABC transporter permease [Azospirillum oleiclasticum]NYZ21930.1 branched-chain amino acid ABC transporter permease [Azospirillum oleiclasticum]
MDTLLIAEQALNGLQFGVMLFLMAAGLTLVFGIMDLINLAHGSFYMVGAYLTAAFVGVFDHFLLALLAAVALTALVGLAVEWTALRSFYRRDHLDQVLATFGLILFFNELARIIWGPVPIFLNPPAALAGTVNLFGLQYPAIRLAILGVGVAVALLLWLLIARTRVGMLIRAGATNREMVMALGVDVRLLFSLVFALGAGLAGLAGAMAGPVLAVQVGMGEQILILTFVVIVIGGIGSVRGALAGALLVGMVDTLGRATLPALFRLFLDPAAANGAGGAAASMAIYVLMALVLAIRPRGLFPAG